MKPITDYTQQELEDKIKAIKAEREKTADALKRYEEELERRKQEVPLGVPIINVSQYKTLYWLGGAGFPWEEKTNLATDIQLERWSFLNVFHSKESAKKHAEMLLEWRKALVANAKGEPIDIKVLLPLLPKGWVAMEKFGKWYWFKCKPVIDVTDEWGYGGKMLYAFNIKPSEDWRNSLMECGL